MAGRNNKPNQPSAEETAAAESAIFGGENTQTTADPLGVVPPAAPSGAPVNPVSTPAPKGVTPEKQDSITLSREQFEQIMGRMSDLESLALNSIRNGEKADVFNPLEEVKSNHIVRVAFHGDKLVVGYKAKQRVDGKKVYTWLAKDQESGEIRTYVTLLLRTLDDETIVEETVDYARFVAEAVTLDATLIQRKDIGKIVEHGLVDQMTWNGKTLVPTGMKIMSGAKEQHFLFTVELNGKTFELPEEVVNIKA